MNTYAYPHLSGPVLLSNLSRHYAQEHGSRALVLAHIAEIDARKLYVPAAHPSMFSYCVGVLGMSRNRASKSIQAARTARQFPAIFPMLAERRLTPSGVCLLAPHLTPDNVGELLNAAAGRSKAEIEAWLRSLSTASQTLSLAAEAAESTDSVIDPRSPANTRPYSPGNTEGPESHPLGASKTPMTPQKATLWIEMSRDMQDDMRYALSLLGHELVSADPSKLLGRALKSLIRELEARKLNRRSSPASRRGSSNPRHIPKEVKRRVWDRDQGRCTFLSDTGHRCPATSSLEFDHIDPVACGGASTVDNLRLRCRAHNQYEAERRFGAGFMHEKRENVQAAALRTRAAGAERGARALSGAAAEVIPYLRHLGVRAGDARDAAAQCESIPHAPIEERVKLALKFYGRRRLGVGNRIEPARSSSPVSTAHLGSA